MNMYYYDDLEDNKEAAQTFLVMNNKSSTILVPYGTLQYCASITLFC